MPVQTTCLHNPDRCINTDESSVPHISCVDAPSKMCGQKWKSTKEIMNNARISSAFQLATEEQFCGELFKVFKTTTVRQ